MLSAEVSAEVSAEETGGDGLVVHLPHGSGYYDRGLSRLRNYDASDEQQQWALKSYRDPHYFALKQKEGNFMRCIESDGVGVTIPICENSPQTLYYDPKTKLLHTRVGSWRCLSHNKTEAVDGDAIVIKSCGAASQWNRQWSGSDGVVFHSATNWQLMLNIKVTSDSWGWYYHLVLSSDWNNRLWTGY